MRNNSNSVRTNINNRNNNTNKHGSSNGSAAQWAAAAEWESYLHREDTNGIRDSLDRDQMDEMKYLGINVR